MVIILAGLFPVAPANADEIRPALLDIKEQNTGLFAVTWKVPTRNGQALAITPKLPASLELLGSPSVQDVPGARVEHTTYKNNKDSLTGQTIVIEGLAAMAGDFFILGDPIFSGLVVALILRLFVSTVLTLIVIPVVYFAAMRNRLEQIRAAIYCPGKE